MSQRHLVWVVVNHVTACNIVLSFYLFPHHRLQSRPRRWLTVKVPSRLSAAALSAGSPAVAAVAASPAKLDYA